jgi:hypothetical protein
MQSSAPKTVLNIVPLSLIKRVLSPQLNSAAIRKLSSSKQNSELQFKDSNLDVLVESHESVKLASEGVNPGRGEPPALPTTCCMSGCANCVWLQYVDELVKYYQDGSGKLRALEEIEKIEDPNLKAFLKLELV